MASYRALSLRLNQWTSNCYRLEGLQPARPLHNTSFNPQSTARLSQTLVATPPLELGEGRGCVLCRNGLDRFGYRDVLLLRQFLTPSGLIIGRRNTGICQKMQNKITRAIRRSRKMGLLPNYSQPE